MINLKDPIKKYTSVAWVGNVASETAETVCMKSFVKAKADKIYFSVYF